MKTNHTAGPWLIDSVDYVHCIGPEGGAVATVVHQQEIPWIDDSKALAYAEDLANARLIAAAPEMLEALRIVLEMHDRQISSLADSAEAAVRVAIAKAEGRS